MNNLNRSTIIAIITRPVAERVFPTPSGPALVRISCHLFILSSASCVINIYFLRIRISIRGSGRRNTRNTFHPRHCVYLPHELLSIYISIRLAFLDAFCPHNGIKRKRVTWEKSEYVNS